MKYLLTLFIFLAGCSSNNIRDFDCYRVAGPVNASGPLNQSELQEMMVNIDKQVQLFSDKPVSYICIDTTPVKEPRTYPKGK
jgi:hypothetical protein